MIDPKIYIEELMASGLTKEEAIAKAKEEVKNRNCICKSNIVIENNRNNRRRINDQWQIK